MQTAGGHHYDGRVAQPRILAHRREHGVAVHVGHQQVQQDQVRAVLPHQLQGDTAVARGSCPAARCHRPHHPREQTRHVGIVVDDQHALDLLR